MSFDVIKKDILKEHLQYCTLNFDVNDDCHKKWSKKEHKRPFRLLQVLTHLN